MRESDLLCYYSDYGPERGGILTNQGIIELKNSCEEPENGFELDFEDLDKLEDVHTIGTWHTHPGKGANLSSEDYEAFLSWPRLKHFIIGKDGVRKYSVRKDCVINES